MLFASLANIQELVDEPWHSHRGARPGDKGRETHTAQYPLAPSTGQEPSLVVSLTSHEKLSGTHLYFTHKETGSEFVKEVLRVLERGLVATCPRMPASSELVSLSNITQHGAQGQEETEDPSFGPNQWEPQLWEPQDQAEPTVHVDRESGTHHVAPAPAWHCLQPPRSPGLTPGSGSACAQGEDSFLEAVQ